MDFKYTNQTYMVVGCTKGIGYQVCTQLLQNDANVIGIARKGLELSQLDEQYPKFTPVKGDISLVETVENCKKAIPVGLHGIFLSPLSMYKKPFAQTTNNDWDQAYSRLVKWKMLLLNAVMPILSRNKTVQTRVVIGETGHVCNVSEGDALNNVLKQISTGLVKTLAKEYGPLNVTVNGVAYEYMGSESLTSHLKTVEKQTNIPFQDLQNSLIDQIPAKKIGQPTDIAKFILWLFSEQSQYLNGQVHYFDGGQSSGI